jgi:hypothetical protein
MPTGEAQNQKSVVDTLERIGRDLKRLNEKVDKIIEVQQKILQKPLGGIGYNQESKVFEALDVMTLLSLPDHLRKTAMITCELGKVSAWDVAGKTNRARAVESSYLNQLVRMGFLKRKREGRVVYFFVGE